MTYIADQTPRLYRFSWEPTTMAIGWLHPDYPFPQGPVAPAVLDRLWHHCQAMQPYRFLWSRGVHACELCRTPPAGPIEHGGMACWLGSGEIRVVSQAGTVYGAPNLIFHYVRDHGYRPPMAFLEALHTGVAPTSRTFQRVMKRLELMMWEYMPVAAAMVLGLEEPRYAQSHHRIGTLVREYQLLGQISEATEPPKDAEIDHEKD